MDFKKDIDIPLAVTLSDVNNIINQMNDFIKTLIKNDTDERREYIQRVETINASLPNLVHNNIIIKPSSLHGNGVFATKDIPKNTIVTFYPPHAIKIGKFRAMLCSKSPNIGDFETNFSKYYGEYSAYNSFSGHSSFVGNPNIISNSLLLGHMINDPVGNIFKNISFEKTKQYDTYKRIVEEYFIKGLKMENCEFAYDKNNLVICVKTTKDIRENEELLVCYEPSYWFNHTYGTNDSDGNHGIIFRNKMFKDPYYQTLMSNLKKFFC